MTVYLLNKMYSFIFQNKQKIVQTLLKWLFWTSINLDIILSEVFVSIPCAFYPVYLNQGRRSRFSGASVFA